VQPGDFVGKLPDEVRGSEVGRYCLLALVVGEVRVVIVDEAGLEFTGQAARLPGKEVKSVLAGQGAKIVGKEILARDGVAAEQRQHEHEGHGEEGAAPEPIPPGAAINSLLGLSRVFYHILSIVGRGETGGAGGLERGAAVCAPAACPSRLRLIGCVI